MQRWTCFSIFPLSADAQEYSTSNVPRLSIPGIKQHLQDAIISQLPNITSESLKQRWQDLKSTCMTSQKRSLHCKSTTTETGLMRMIPPSRTYRRRYYSSKPVDVADGTHLSERKDILARLREHFCTLPNQPGTPDLSVLDGILQEEVISKLEQVPTIDKVNKSLQNNSRKARHQAQMAFLERSWRLEAKHSRQKSTNFCWLSWK